MISNTQILAGPHLDEFYAQIDAGATTSVLRDSTNSTIALTSSTAATMGTYAYSPYGETTGSGTANTPLQFTGRENDGVTGLYYYRARYYSAQIGRFISEDPIGLVGGINTYAYAAGNPISYIDPLGLYGLVASAGFHLPVAVGIAVGPAVSSSIENYSGNPRLDLNYDGVVTELEAGAIIDAGASVGVNDLSDTHGACAGATFTLGLGRRSGVSLTFRTNQDTSRFILNPLRYIDGFSFGLGVGIAVPVTVTVPVTKPYY